MEDLKLLTLEEVAEIIGIQRRTIYNYIKEGKLKAVRIGKYWRVKQEDIKDFIEVGTKRKL